MGVLLTLVFVFSGTLTKKEKKMKLKVDKRVLSVLMNLLRQKGIEPLSINGKNDDVYVEIAPPSLHLIKNDLDRFSIKVIS